MGDSKLTDQARTNQQFWAVENIVSDTYMTSAGPYAWTVYTLLCRRANAAGTCFPKYNTIAADCGMSKRAAINAIQKLTEIGLIVKIREEHKSNTYQVLNATELGLIQRTVKGGAGDAPLEPGGMHDVHPGVQEVHPGGAGGAPLGVQEVHPKYTKGSRPNEVDPQKNSRVGLTRREIAERMVEIFGEECPGLPKVRMINDSLSATAAARFNDELDKSFENWRAFCTRIAASSFLSKKMNQGRGVDFGWVVGPKNFVKIANGKYDDNNNSSSLYRRGLAQETPNAAP